MIVKKIPHTYHVLKLKKGVKIRTDRKKIYKTTSDLFANMALSTGKFDYIGNYFNNGMVMKGYLTAPNLPFKYLPKDVLDKWRVIVRLIG